MKSAMQSDALVSSLFPEDVRNRIYEEMNSKAQAKANESNWRNKGGDVNRHEDSISHDDSTAIARLYPETTIFFADLVGFTGKHERRHISLLLIPQYPPAHEFPPKAKPCSKTISLGLHTINVCRARFLLKV